jgi:class 3 adenylate cyclase/tetratricopeptide (TPR) repeat protein
MTRASRTSVSGYVARCSRCGDDNFADSRFCTQCGAGLEECCPACQADNPTGARFCRRCGATLSRGGDPREPVARAEEGFRTHHGEGERRHMTTMFCDLVDSVILGERLDPEELHEVIHAYQEGCAAVVARHDGHIAQYSGDGLLVYFGYPIAHEDDAQRATQAGLDIIEEVRRLNARVEALRGIRLAVRVGIHSGLIVVGNTGGGEEGEKQIIGHAVNLAARLQGVADADSVLISAATLHLVRGLYRIEELGPRSLKGIAEPVNVYRVLGPSGARNRFEVSAAAGLTPFVGREHEIALILERWQQAVDGRGQVVLLTGEAGIGKSRLVCELRERLAQVPHLWLEAHCSPYHEHSALHPVVELLDLQLGRHGTPAERGAALEGAVEQAGLPVAEATSLFAALLSLPQSDRVAPGRWSPEVQRRKTLELLVAWLLNSSAARPVVLLVEDLHWVDPSTNELLGMMLEQSTTASILILVTSRPGNDVPWPDRSNLTHLTLQPLTRLQVGAMIERIAGGRSVPAEVHRQVVRTTDGVPLFVEEFTKAVLESNLVCETASGYIPSTLQDSLTARLDRLGAAKDVAQLGAVLGREFSYELLRAVAPGETSFLDHALRELVRAELLFQRGTPPRATYRFKHALVQEAAYRSLLRGRRHGAHARIARILAERFPERVAAEPEEMARHCAEGRLNAEAIRYYRLAAGRAMDCFAQLEAVGHLTRALELCAALRPGRERDQEELALRVALGPPLIAIRGYGDPEVEVVYERARSLCQESEDAPHLFETVWGLANYYQSRGALGTAKDLGEQLVTIAAHANDARLIVWADLQLGATLFWQGEPAAALPRLESAIALHDPAGRRLFPGSAEPGVAARVYAALALWQLGYPDRALRSSQEGIAAGRTCGDAFSLALALSFASMLHQSRREPAVVRVLADEVLTLATAQEFPLWRELGRVFLGWADAHADGSSAAVEEIEQGLARLATIGTEVGAAGGLGLLAEAKHAIGRTEDALGAVDSALAVAELRGQRTWDSDLSRLKGDILVRMERAGHADQAERCFVRALEASRSQRATSLELRAATSLGRLLGRHGRRAEARVLLDGIYHRFTEGFETPDLRDACAVLSAV